jgi:predicted HTH transcriptional regulator
MAPGAGSKPQSNQPEEMLGVWLDEVTELLLDVGSRAQDAWDRAKSLETRTALQETILTLAIQHGRVTAGDVLRATGANRNTVKDNLARLVEEGSLLKHGQKRGTIYVPA